MENLKRYEVTDGAPKKFVAFAPGFGVHEFSTEHLTDQEAEALAQVNCPYIKEKKPAAERASKPGQ